MGYMRHDAIVATNWDTESVRAAHAQAKELGLCPSSICGPFVNGYSSFMIPPDGSKEGWEESCEFDDRRDAWKTWVGENFGDGHGRWLSWVHVQFAGDEPSDNRIVDSDKSGNEEEAE